MGYSAHVPCKSKKERDEMFAFLEEHYRPFSKVVAGAGCLDYFVADEKEFENRNFEHHDSICGPCREGLSYIPDDSDFYIGFDFMTSGGAEGQWMFEFLRWVATKVGVMTSRQGPTIWIAGGQFLNVRNSVTWTKSSSSSSPTIRSRGCFELFNRVGKCPGTPSNMISGSV